MKSLTEYLTESSKTIEFERSKYKDFWMDSESWMNIQPYAEEIYNAYVNNFGDKAPKSPDSTGMRQAPFERNLHQLVDTNRLSVYAFSLVKYYVFFRLTGSEPDQALEEAKETYNSKMKRLGASSEMI